MFFWYILIFINLINFRNRGARLTIYLENLDCWFAYIICGTIVINKTFITNCKISKVKKVDEQETFYYPRRQSKSLTCLSNNCNQKSLNSEINNKTKSNPENIVDNNIKNLFILTKKTSVTIAIISRISWHYEGFHINIKGVDDYGNAANFIETEQVYFKNFKIYIY